MKNRLAMRFSLEAHHIWKIVAVLFDGTAKDVKTADDVAHLTENDRLVVFVDTNIPVLPGNTYSNRTILLSHYDALSVPVIQVHTS